MSDAESAGKPTPVYTLFDAKTTSVLTKDDLTDLAAGTLAAIWVEGFFDKDLCSELMENLETVELGSYDEQVVSPRIAKLGPAAYDYYIGAGIGEDYWKHRDESDATRARLSSKGDPQEQALDVLSRAWGGKVDNATIGGRRLFAGMLREINDGARIHFDEVERELPGGLDDTSIAQLAFNCHLDMPDQGGEATVYRRRWIPSDEEHRDGYGYAEYLVKEQPTVSVRAEVGDAVLFDPRNYHRVKLTVLRGVA